MMSPGRFQPRMKNAAPAKTAMMVPATMALELN
jgi:hypothetical protein